MFFTYRVQCFYVSLHIKMFLLHVAGNQQFEVLNIFMGEGGLLRRPMKWKHRFLSRKWREKEWKKEIKTEINTETKKIN